MTTTLDCHSTRIPRVNVGNSLRFVKTGRIQKQKITIDVFFSVQRDYGKKQMQEIEPISVIYYLEVICLEKINWDKIL